MKHHLIAPEIAPAIENGCDWSATGLVLLTTADRSVRLIWRKGGRYTSGQSRRYGGSQLTIVRADRYRDHWVNLGESGGRLSKGRIAAQLAEIDGAFGDGATKIALLAFAATHTAVIEPEA
jgi:hypothetical protein